MGRKPIRRGANPYISGAPALDGGAQKKTAGFHCYRHDGRRIRGGAVFRTAIFNEDT